MVIHSAASGDGMGFKRGPFQPSELGVCFVCGGQGQRIRFKDTLVTLACAKTAPKLLEVVLLTRAAEEVSTAILWGKGGERRGDEIENPGPMDGITKSVRCNICNHYSPRTQRHGRGLGCKKQLQAVRRRQEPLVRCAAHLPCHSQPPSAIHPKITDDCADQFNSPYSFLFPDRDDHPRGFVDEFGSKRSLFALAHTRSALAPANWVPDLPVGLQLIISTMSTLSLPLHLQLLGKAANPQRENV